ncbi:unnamed protein product, partial [marine sediment metagenome]
RYPALYFYFAVVDFGNQPRNCNTVMVEQQFAPKIS